MSTRVPCAPWVGPGGRAPLFFTQWESQTAGQKTNNGKSGAQSGRGCDLLWVGVQPRWAWQRGAEKGHSSVLFAPSPPWRLLAGPWPRVKTVPLVVSLPELWLGGRLSSPAVSPRLPAHRVRAFPGLSHLAEGSSRKRPPPAAPLPAPASSLSGSVSKGMTGASPTPHNSGSACTLVPILPDSAQLLPKRLHPGPASDPGGLPGLPAPWGEDRPPTVPGGTCQPLRMLLYILDPNAPRSL